jgi:hypothetical protein
MNTKKMHSCSVCGQDTSLAPGFLLAENRWEDKLKILQWDERLANTRGILHVCSAAHVRQYVVGWMATGSLHDPFTQAGEAVAITLQRNEIDTSGARQIGELAVHRDSMRGILRERPLSLKCILDALTVSLLAEPKPAIPTARWYETVQSGTMACAASIRSMV